MPANPKTRPRGMLHEALGRSFSQLLYLSHGADAVSTSRKLWDTQSVDVPRRQCHRHIEHLLHIHVLTQLAVRTLRPEVSMRSRGEKRLDWNRGTCGEQFCTQTSGGMSFQNKSNEFVT